MNKRLKALISILVAAAFVIPTTIIFNEASATPILISSEIDPDPAECCEPANITATVDDKELGEHIEMVQVNITNPGGATVVPWKNMTKVPNCYNWTYEILACTLNKTGLWHYQIRARNCTQYGYGYWTGYNAGDPWHPADISFKKVPFWVNDTKPPDITILTPPTTIKCCNGYNFTAEINDTCCYWNATPIKNASIWYDGPDGTGHWWMKKNGDDIWYYEHAHFGIDDVGVWNCTVNATDCNGNNATEWMNFTVIYEKGYVEIKFGEPKYIGPNPEPWIEPGLLGEIATWIDCTTPINLTAPPCCYIHYRIWNFTGGWGRDEGEGKCILNYTEFNISWYYGHCDECKHKIEYWCETPDDPGNSSKHYYQYFYVDNTPPNITKEYGKPICFAPPVCTPKTWMDETFDDDLGSWDTDYFVWDNWDGSGLSADGWGGLAELYWGNMGTSTSAYLKSPSFDTSDACNLWLDWDQLIFNCIYENDYFVEIAPDGSTWTDITPWANPAGGTNTCSDPLSEENVSQYTINVSAFSGPNTQIRFSYNQNGSIGLNWFFIDNVKLYGEYLPEVGSICITNETPIYLNATEGEWNIENKSCPSGVDYIEYANYWNGTFTTGNITGETYAVMVGGGYDKDSNHAAFWNDLADMYNMMIDDYYMSPDDIYVLWANGTQPDANNMGTTWIGLPGVIDPTAIPTSEIDYSATTANLETVFDILAGKMTEDDELFIFMTNHGGTDPYIGTGTYWGWNVTNPITDGVHLGHLIKDIPHYKHVNVVISSCHAGGFVGELSMVDDVYVATATRYDEFGWTIKYSAAGNAGGTNSEVRGLYTYGFLSAFKGEHLDGTPLYYDPDGPAPTMPVGCVDCINAPYEGGNGDGCVSFKEAFNYAVYWNDMFLYYNGPLSGVYWPEPVDGGNMTAGDDCPGLIDEAWVTIDGDSGIIYKEEDCQHTILYRAVDKLGHVSEIHEQIVYVDNIPPAIEDVNVSAPWYENHVAKNMTRGCVNITAIVVDEGCCLNNTVTVVLEVDVLNSSAESGITIVKVNMTPMGGNKYYFNFCDNFTFDGKDFTNNTAENGLYTFRIIAKDCLGNENTTSGKFWIKPMCDIDVIELLEPDPSIWHPEMPTKVKAVIKNNGICNVTDPIPILLQIYEEIDVEARPYICWDMESCIVSGIWDVESWDGDIFTWTWTEKNSHSPTHSWHSQPDLAAAYEKNSFDSLYLNNGSQGILIPDLFMDNDTVSEAYLTFYHYCEGEFSGSIPVDFGNLSIRWYNDTGSKWMNWAEIGGPYYDTEGDWELVTIDISKYIGNYTQFNWSWFSDDTWNYEGWYIDDVCIELVGNRQPLVYQEYKYVYGLEQNETKIFEFPLDFTPKPDTWYFFEIYADVGCCYCDDVCYGDVDGPKDDNYDVRADPRTGYPYKDPWNGVNESLYFGDVCDAAILSINAPSEVEMPNSGVASVPITAEVYNNGTLTEDVPVELKVQHLLKDIFFSDDMESGEGEWDPYNFGPEDGMWHLSEMDYGISPTHSWYLGDEVDAANHEGYYSNNANGMCLGTAEFDLSDYLATGKELYMKWQMTYAIEETHSTWPAHPTNPYGDPGEDHDSIWMGGCVGPAHNLWLRYTGTARDGFKGWHEATPAEFFAGYFPDDADGIISMNDLYYDFNDWSIDNGYGDMGGVLKLFWWFQSDATVNTYSPGTGWSGVFIDDVEIYELGAGATVYSEVKIVEDLEPGETATLDFTWNTTQYCDYLITATNILDCDIDPTNNEKSTPTRIYEQIYTDVEKFTLEDNTCGFPDDWHIVEECSICADDHFWWNGLDAPNDDGLVNYANDRNDVLTVNHIFNWTDATKVYINFSTYYIIEEAYDYGYLEISNDSGMTWFAVGDTERSADAYFTGGSEGWVDLNWSLEPGSGFTKLYSIYTDFEFDMPADFFTDEMHVRFRFYSDVGTTDKGWFIDDVELNVFNGSWSVDFFDDMEDAVSSAENWTHMMICYGNHWHNTSDFGNGPTDEWYYNGEERNWTEIGSTLVYMLPDTGFDPLPENMTFEQVGVGYHKNETGRFLFLWSAAATGCHQWLNMTNVTLVDVTTIYLEFDINNFVAGNPPPQASGHEIYEVTVTDVSGVVPPLTQTIEQSPASAATVHNKVDISAFRGKTLNISFYFYGESNYDQLNLYTIDINAFLPGLALPYHKYYNNVDEKLIFEFNLTTAYEAFLTFDHNFTMESYKDYGYLEISTDGGETWKLVTKPWTGPSGGWTHERIDITKFAGGDEPILVRFKFVSDETGIDVGWMIDNVGIDGKINTHAPTTTCTLSPASPDGNHGWYVSPVTITLTATDDTEVAATYYRIDGGAWLTYTAPITISVDGTHWVDYYSVDLVGNAEPMKSTISFKIDTKAPTGEITVPKDGYLYIFGSEIMPTPIIGKTLIIGPLTAEATASDAMSGVYYVTFVTSKGSVDDAVSPYQYDLPFYLIGTDTLTVSATDDAGNSAEIGSVDYIKIL